jgi:hypothetical protein
VDWIAEEFAALDCRDQRRNTRFRQLASAWWHTLETSISGVCRQGWAEAMAGYRLIKSKYVTLEVILAPHRAMTLARARCEAVILAIQDTTECDYSGRPIATAPTDGVGPLNTLRRVGFFAHVLYLVTPARQPVGLWACTTLVRTALQNKTRTREHKRQPLAEKESVRWLAGYQAACALAVEAAPTRVVSLADREGDIYEIFVEADKATARAAWVIRANQDRAVRIAGRKKALPLRLLLGLSPRRALATLTVPAAPGRTARQAVCAVHAETVTVRPPYRPDGKLATVTLQAVSVRELQPPPGEARIEWVLLTSLPIAELPDLLQVIHYYAARWEIEVFFRILKTGCRVEELQQHTLSRLLPCFGLCLILAWRLHWLMRLGQLTPEVPCTVAFAPVEWQVLAVLATGQSPPPTPPSVGTALRWLATVGGFLGRKHDGHPGAEVLWRGWQRAREAIRLQGLLHQGVRCV